jgi:hypothetical protein
MIAEKAADHLKSALRPISTSLVSAIANLGVQSTEVGLRIGLDPALRIEDHRVNRYCTSAPHIRGGLKMALMMPTSL